MEYVTWYWALTGAVETLESLRARWSGNYQKGTFGSWGSMTQVHAQILSCLSGELSGKWELSENLVTWWTRKWSERLELSKPVGYLWETWEINKLFKIAQFWIIPKFCCDRKLQPCFGYIFLIYTFTVNEKNPNNSSPFIQSLPKK